MTAAVCSVPVATPTTDIFRNPSTRLGESRSLDTLDTLDPLDPDPWPSWHISATIAQDADNKYADVSTYYRITRTHRLSSRILPGRKKKEHTVGVHVMAALAYFARSRCSVVHRPSPTASVKGGGVFAGLPALSRYIPGTCVYGVCSHVRRYGIPGTKVLYVTVRA